MPFLLPQNIPKEPCRSPQSAKTRSLIIENKRVPDSYSPMIAGFFHICDNTYIQRKFTSKVAGKINATKHSPLSIARRRELQAEEAILHTAPSLRIVFEFPGDMNVSPLPSPQPHTHTHMRNFTHGEQADTWTNGRTDGRNIHAGGVAYRLERRKRMYDVNVAGLSRRFQDYVYADCLRIVYVTRTRPFFTQARCELCRTPRIGLESRSRCRSFQIASAANCPRLCPLQIVSKSGFQDYVCADCLRDVCAAVFHADAKRTV